MMIMMKMKKNELMMMNLILDILYNFNKTGAKNDFSHIITVKTNVDLTESVNRG